MTDQKPQAQQANRLFDIESPLAIELRRIMIRLGRSVDFDRPRCLMVTSAQRGEGKSLFSSHFSLVLAHHMKKRVLLVDGDLRRPVQHVVYQVPREPGFAEQLRGEPFAPRHSALPNLDLLPAGDGAQDTSRLLAATSVHAAVEQWKQAYDIVVLDSPPVVPVSDPLQFVDAVDGVIYLVMAGRTPRDIVLRGAQILQGVGANILGVVANNFSEVLPYYHDRKYYGYAERKEHAARDAARSPTPGGGIDGVAPGPRGAGGDTEQPGA
ncbi:MAG: CpsD/CapB family tyrosine-protein kinase [Candidatus Krumholzibacteriia bacterium]